MNTKPQEGLHAHLFVTYVRQVVCVPCNLFWGGTLSISCRCKNGIIAFMCSTLQSSLRHYHAAELPLRWVCNYGTCDELVFSLQFNEPQPHSAVFFDKSTYTMSTSTSCVVVKRGKQVPNTQSFKVQLVRDVVTSSTFVYIHLSTIF